MRGAFESVAELALKGHGFQPCRTDTSASTGEAGKPHPFKTETQDKLVLSFLATLQYTSTASVNCCFSTYSPSVCATWIDPGPMRIGCPQLLSAGMSVVNAAIIVGSPSKVRRRTAGISSVNST